MRLASCPSRTLFFSARVSAGIVIIALCLLFSVIIVFALPAFVTQESHGVLSLSWNPYKNTFGILPMLTGSLLLSFSTLVVAWPFSLLICFWLLTAKQSLLLSVIKVCLRLMAAIPTVIYGFAAIFLITPLIRAGFGGSGLCWLSAIIALTFLVTPSIVLVMESGLAPRLQRLCPSGLALGLDRFELLWFFIVPQEKKVLFAGLLLGFGRAIGDTLLPLMLSGNAPQFPLALSDGLRTLSAHMALVTANEVGGSAYNSLFAAGAMLLCINALTSLLLRAVTAQFDKTEEKV